MKTNKVAIKRTVKLASVPTQSPAVESINHDMIGAEPHYGNFTNEAVAHLQQAEALALLICGEGFNAFAGMDESFQERVLWLLSCEVSRAARAAEFESAKGAAA